MGEACGLHHTTHFNMAIIIGKIEGADQMWPSKDDEQRVSHRENTEHYK